MLAISMCQIRKCKHYIGIIQPDGTELTEVNTCTAFPNGIPATIAYWSNRHFKPLEDQGNDIIFEKIKE